MPRKCTNMEFVLIRHEAPLVTCLVDKCRQSIHNMKDLGTHSEHRITVVTLYSPSTIRVSFTIPDLRQRGISRLRPFKFPFHLDHENPEKQLPMPPYQQYPTSDPETPSNTNYSQFSASTSPHS